MSYGRLLSTTGNMSISWYLVLMPSIERHVRTGIEKIVIGSEITISFKVKAPNA